MPAFRHNLPSSPRPTFRGATLLPCPLRTLRRRSLWRDRCHGRLPSSVDLTARLSDTPGSVLRLCSIPTPSSAVNMLAWPHAVPGYSLPAKISQFLFLPLTPFYTLLPAFHLTLPFHSCLPCALLWPPLPTIHLSWEERRAEEIVYETFRYGTDMGRGGGRSEAEPEKKVAYDKPIHYSLMPCSAITSSPLMPSHGTENNGEHVEGALQCCIRLPPVSSLLSFISNIMSAFMSCAAWKEEINSYYRPPLNQLIML